MQRSASPRLLTDLSLASHDRSSRPDQTRTIDDGIIAENLIALATRTQALHRHWIGLEPTGASIAPDGLLTDVAWLRCGHR